MNNRVITFIFSILLLTIILVAIDKCSTNHSLKESSDMETKAVERENTLNSAAEKEVIRDTIYADRWHEAKRGKAKVDSIMVIDSASIEKLRDSLGITNRKSVAQFYALESANKQLVLADSTIKADSLIKRDLWEANKHADTLLASKDKTITELKKHGKKQYLKGFIHGIGVGSIGTLLIVK